MAVAKKVTPAKRKAPKRTGLVELSAAEEAAARREIEEIQSRLDRGLVALHAKLDRMLARYEA